MKNCFYAFACLSLLFACQKNASNDRLDTNEVIKIDEDMLLFHVKAMSHDSLEGRYFGTEGNYKTQRFIAQQFDSLGIAPAFPSGSIQKYPYTFQGEARQKMYPIANPTKDFSNVPDTTVIGGNVVTMIEGEMKQAIVITGHFDHLGVKDGEIFNGADDNASGAAALFTIANYFKNKSPKHSLVFAAVDAEEVGYLGSKYFIENLPFPIENIVLNINMDMISHNNSSELVASGLYHYPQLKQPLDDLKQTNIKLLYGHDDPNNATQDDWTFSSDHRIFHEKQIPFIYFGVEDHEDYHQPSDTYENINEAFYADAVRLIIEAIEGYDTFLAKQKD
ncbi:MAG: M20/M25/M40 family metallo-hydrolase [Cyclobacteriaceae bacterium]